MLSGPEITKTIFFHKEHNKISVYDPFISRSQYRISHRRKIETSILYHMFEPCHRSHLTLQQGDSFHQLITILYGPWINHLDL